MIRSVLEKLLNRSYSDEPEFGGDEERKSYPWDRLQEKNFLIPNGTQNVISCPTCDQFADVGWIHPKGGGDIPMASCVDCGIYEIDPQLLHRWKLRLETILECLVEKLELRGGIQTHVPNLLWRLGRKKAREYLYVRRYDPEERRLLRNELSKMPKAIVITGTKPILEEIRFDHDHASFSLDSVAILNEETDLVIDFESLKDILGDDTISVKEKPAAVAPKRGSRTAKMEKLVHEMEEHLKTAREHARATAENGCIELLPRPSLGDLAKRTGLSKMDVSRCLNDPDAQILRYLWQQADDLKGILK